MRREKGLKGLLDDYKLFPGLGVHWVVLGSNGQETRPPNGGVMRAYDKCSAGPNMHVKTIVNNYFVEEIRFMHNQIYRCDFSWLVCCRPAVELVRLALRSPLDKKLGWCLRGCLFVQSLNSIDHPSRTRQDIEYSCYLEYGLEAMSYDMHAAARAASISLLIWKGQRVLTLNALQG